MGTQRYSPQFKQTVVEELLAGAKRPRQICREHGIDFSTLRKWPEQYAQHGPGAWSTPAAKTANAVQPRSVNGQRRNWRLSATACRGIRGAMGLWFQSHSQALPGRRYRRGTLSV